MKIRLPGLAWLVFALAACSSGSGGDVSTGSGNDVRQPVAAAPAPSIHSGQASAFATMPDHGELVAYRPIGPRLEGPSTWYRVDLSEAHALRAVAAGRLRLPAPDGEVLDYAFQRHIEHPNGNWSWIGKLGDTAGQAILTFGERAAFGLFHRPGKPPLQLTMRDGVTWIVESDPRALRGVDPTGTPDYLKPTQIKAAAASPDRTIPGAAAVSATASTGPVVDLVLGYTVGFANTLGGQSQAVTRLTHLVTVTNQAYANSQFGAQVRLVHTLQVNYPDNTANDAALNELTGSNGSSSVTVPASLVPLRQARDLYGGDLVSLVRKFSDPENAGCGIAWLIGGGGTSFTTSDAPWGYSVVSDGEDGGFFCRTETLAHELGHNMGQNHNVEDSGGDSGVHAYSYGYREASASGFFTIMAYRLGGSQYSIPYFANPNVSVDGRATGVVNASDNVRSMAVTFPIVGGFRGTVVPLGLPEHDFDGDGKSDILWRNSGNGTNTIWRGANSTTVQAVSTVASQSWQVAGAGDFNGDGRSDILWRNSSSGQNTVWRSGNSSTIQAVATVASADWQVAGVGDFNGDGTSDILWRNLADGRNTIWSSADAATSVAVATAATSWRVAGVGDFNADGKADILWRNGTDGRNLIWRSASSALSQPVAAVTSQAWQVAGIGDFDSDGYSDILWRHGTQGTNAIWRSANSATPQAVAPVASLDWRVAGVGDFDADGRSDILWRHGSQGWNSIWKGGNSATPMTVSTVANLAWRVAW